MPLLSPSLPLSSVGIDVVVSTFDTLTLPAGGPSVASFPVSLVDDTIAEASEWFLVSLSMGSDEGETIVGMGTANITILDNDCKEISHKKFNISLYM